MIKTIVVKREIFKFTNLSPSKIAAIGPAEAPISGQTAPYQPIKWNLDAISRLTGIFILLVCIYLLFKLTKILLESSLSADKELNPEDILKFKKPVFQWKYFKTLHGSNLIKVAYETYRGVLDKDLELTPLEFLEKYPNSSLGDITHEYVLTEYGLKPTNVRVEVIQSWIEKLEETLT